MGLESLFLFSISVGLSLYTDPLSDYIRLGSLGSVSKLNILTETMKSGGSLLFGDKLTITSLKRELKLRSEQSDSYP